MREAIGGTWITQLVIGFMLIFVAFLALSLNYTKAFKVKNEILSIIEKYEGLTDGSNGSVAIINNYLLSNGYNVTKNCPAESYGATSLTDQNPTLEYVKKGSTKKYYYCVSKIKSASSNSNNIGQVYYKINVFFYFNLPVIGDIFKFDINGSTGNIIYPADNLIAN